MAQAKLIAEMPTDLLVVTAGLPFKVTRSLIFDNYVPLPVIAMQKSELPTVYFVYFFCEPRSGDESVAHFAPYDSVERIFKLFVAVHCCFFEPQKCAHAQSNTRVSRRPRAKTILWQRLVAHGRVFVSDQLT